MDWAEAVQKETEAFRGTAGVVVSSLADGREVSHNAEKVFSSASLIKLGVLYTLFSRMLPARSTLTNGVIFPLLCPLTEGCFTGSVPEHGCGWMTWPSS